MMVNLFRWLFRLIAMRKPRFFALFQILTRTVLGRFRGSSGLSFLDDLRTGEAVPAR